MIKQPAEDQYDLVDDIRVSHAGTAEDDDYTCLVGEPCALTSRFWTGDRRVQTHVVPSVNALSAREAARGEADRRVVRGSAGCESSSSSASEKKGKGKGSARSGKVEEKRNLRYGEFRRNESKRSGCREPHTAFSFARKAESLWDSDSPRGVHGRVNYSEKNVPVAVIEVRWPLTWQEDLIAK